MVSAIVMDVSSVGILDDSGSMGDARVKERQWAAGTRVVVAVIRVVFLISILDKSSCLGGSGITVATTTSILDGSLDVAGGSVLVALAAFEPSDDFNVACWRARRCAANVAGRRAWHLVAMGNTGASVVTTYVTARFL